MEKEPDLTKVKIVAYHGSPASNLSSILQNGIVPRSREECNRIIDRTLQLYGQTRKSVPGWVWSGEYYRCKEIGRSVYLSSSWSFAKLNSQAGRESEGNIRRSLFRWKYGKEKLSQEEYEEYEKAQEPTSVIFKVKVPLNRVNQLPELKGRVKFIMEFIKTDSPMKAWRWMVRRLTEVTVNRVYPHEIINYRIVKYS